MLEDDKKSDLVAELTGLKQLHAGRSGTLLKAVVAKEVQGGISNWRATQLVKFVQVVDWLVEDLPSAYDQERTMTVAWIARGLLELYTWMRWCNVREANAKRFDEDAARDFYNSCKALNGLNIDDDPESKGSVEKMLAGYSNWAKSQGIDDVSADYTRVSKAAEEIGEGKLFSSMNKIYSKFAHPTALAVEALAQTKYRNGYRDLFAMDAIDFASRCLDMVTLFLLTEYEEKSQ